MFQTTIHKTVRCKGIGLHSGKKVELALRPALEDTGILFCIENASGSSFLAPNPDLVVSTGLATTLGNGRESVATVEHLLAAVRGLGIDNIRIDIQGGEVPIMDGSAAPFVYLLKQARLRRQEKPRRVLAVKREIVFEKDGRSVRATPYDGFFMDCAIEFPHPLIGRQRLSVDVRPESFERELSRARTFGFLKEVEYLHANGLALGGSLENAVVLDDYGVVNDDGLRFEDEFVRHKALDFLGDMAMLGKPLYGRFEIFAPGHRLNNDFLRHLSANAADLLEERTLAAGEALRAPRPFSPRVEPLPAVA